VTLLFTTVRSSVRSRLAPPSFQSLSTALSPKHVPLRSNPRDSKADLCVPSVSSANLFVLWEIQICVPFAFCFRAYHCFACTWMSSAALHVIVFTFGDGFDSRLPPQYLSELALLRSVCDPSAAHWAIAVGYSNPVSRWCSLKTHEELVLACSSSWLLVAASPSPGLACRPCFLPSTWPARRYQLGMALRVTMRDENESLRLPAPMCSCCRPPSA
jgi:hypothetical protein